MSTEVISDFPREDLVTRRRKDLRGKEMLVGSGQTGGGKAYSAIILVVLGDVFGGLCVCVRACMYMCEMEVYFVKA